METRSNVRNGACKLQKKKKQTIKNKKTEEPLAHLHKLKQTRAYNQIETRH